MRKKIVIAGGGTGGHLFPGIALARSLMKYDPEFQITFVGTERGIESKVLPKEGLTLKTIDSAGLLGKKGLKRWTGWLKLPISLAQSLTLLLKERPSLVIGVGGYVSGPVALAARMLFIPILIHEQNTIPGVTNRLLGKIVNKVAISFQEGEKYFPKEKVVFTGNMIREEFSNASEPDTTPKEKTTILLLGGSQGAHSINQAMAEALNFLESAKNQLTFIHQTGETDEKKLKNHYQEKGFEAEVNAFIFDMANQYQKASLVICRAGATTLAELTAMGKASILIPFPFAAHNHQEHNAQTLVQAGAAEMILDRDISGRRLADSILFALKNPGEIIKRSKKSFQLGKRNATNQVRNICLEMMKIAA